MKLIEYDGKALLARYGLHAMTARLIEPGMADLASCCTGDAVVKAQILEGKRGKAGLIKRVDAASAAGVIGELRARLVERGQEPLLSIEDVVDIAAEYYLAIRIDDVRQVPVVLFSAHGGMDIEDKPDSVVTCEVPPLRGLQPHHLIPMLRSSGLPPGQWGAVARFIAQLYEIFVREDAELIEINPLALTGKNALVPVDAKIELDASADFRHPDRALMRSFSLGSPTTTPLEAKAAGYGISLVELPGDVALITSGAGLGMAVVDELADNGLYPANFVDAPGGVGLEMKIDIVLELARESRVKAVGCYILQAGQPLSRAVGSLLSALEKGQAPKPMVVGLMAAAAGERGMTLAEAKARLQAHGLVVVSELGDLVAELKKVVHA